jgi:hypothetical protein
MLISISDIISLAYITNIDEKLIKDEVIDLVIQTYLVPVLTESFYTEITIDPNSYTDLIDKYIKPCIAFYVKYLLYSQQLFETAQYSSPDPARASEFIDPSISSVISYDVHRTILKNILFIARQKEQILIKHLNTGVYDHYTKPSKQRINGFLISS